MPSPWLNYDTWDRVHTDFSVILDGLLGYRVWEWGKNTLPASLSLSLRKPCLPFPCFDKDPNDSAVLRKPPKGPNVEPKMDIILRLPAMAVLFNKENNTDRSFLLGRTCSEREYPHDFSDESSSVFLILVMTGRTGPPDLVMDTQRQGKEIELKKKTV